VARYVERHRARLGLPGVAVRVATGDSVVLAVAFGRGTRGGEPITPRGPGVLGWVPKAGTGAATMLLAQEGRIDRTAPVEDVLPGFTMRGRFTPRSITPTHLLQHRSGFSQWSGHDRRAQATGETAHLKPRRAPDTEGEYSSLNYIVLGQVVRAAAGAEYATVMHERFFAPLGMQNASVAGADPVTPTAVLGHQSYFGWQIARREPSPPAFLVPAGFVAASAEDMGRFAGMMVGGGSFAGTSILEPATIAAILGPLDTTGRAMGWGRAQRQGELVLEHAGNARTSSARVRLVPNSGYAITVLTNTNTGPFFSATDELTEGIHAILAGNRPRPVWPRERLLKGAILAASIYSIAQAGRHARAWDRAGRPTHLEGSAHAIKPLAFELASGAFVLVGLPRIFGVPLHTMHEYFPDLSIALWSGAIAGVAGGTFRALERSAP
jgi:CubicO group peptidase (beta-lactamase class C family)